MSDYFLHSECGYTFDRHGTIAALTQAEERRLWKGLALWNEEVEDQGEAAGDASEQRKAQQRQQAKRADNRRFEELSSGSETKRN